jgi:hypothetical protein
MLVAYGAKQKAEPQVLRARGLVLVDDQGRERILIGAPIPSASHRVRTDDARVREAWAGRYPDPDEYMKYYAGYDNSTNGMLILDENGFDRVAVGSPTPDPNIGRRLGPSTGIVINDAQGFERSGYGLLTVNGSDRVVLGLDSNRGTEGLVLSLHDESGYVGMDVASGSDRIFVGSKNGQKPDGEPSSELAITRGDSILYSTQAHGSK